MACEVERSTVGVVGLVVAAGATQEPGAGGVEVSVVVEAVEDGGCSTPAPGCPKTNAAKHSPSGTSTTTTTDPTAQPKVNRRHPGYAMA